MSPKIFVIARGVICGNINAGALAEDGTPLCGHLSSTIAWAQHDMGLTGPWKHDLYAKHYPDGYELVDLLLDSHRLADFPDYMAALERNKARATENPESEVRA